MRIDFLQTGGYRLETDTLKLMQDAYSLFHSLGEVIGNKSIIKGCNVIGNTVSDGVIYLNGELLFFQGGQAQTKVIVTETVENLTFLDGESKPTFYKRKASFGTGIDAILWSEFKRVYPLTSALYIDKVDMYAGDLNAIPSGWFLCNGENGTVDLRGRFIAGLNPDDAEYDTIGKVGGLKEVALSKPQMPVHKHTGTIAIGPQNIQISQTAGTSEGGGRIATGSSPAEGSISLPMSSTLSGTVSISNEGGGEAHENRPPFYTLAYIQFKG